MPRYEFIPKDVSTSILVLPADDYEFLIGEPKPYAFQTKGGENKPSEDRYGVRFPLRVMTSGAFENKMIFFSGDQSSDIGQQVTKGFIMAALGYGKGREEEERFDMDHGTDDFGFDTDSGFIGDGWRQVKDMRVVGSLGINIDKNDPSKQYQKFAGFRRIGDE